MKNDIVFFTVAIRMEKKLSLELLIQPSVNNYIVFLLVGLTGKRRSAMIVWYILADTVCVAGGRLKR